VRAVWPSPVFSRRRRVMRLKNGLAKRLRRPGENDIAHPLTKTRKVYIKLHGLVQPFFAHSRRSLETNNDVLMLIMFAV
jgi:hypothetical protein